MPTATTIATTEKKSIVTKKSNRVMLLASTALCASMIVGFVGQMTTSALANTYQIGAAMPVTYGPGVNPWPGGFIVAPGNTLPIVFNITDAGTVGQYDWAFGPAASVTFNITAPIVGAAAGPVGSWTIADGSVVTYNVGAAVTGTNGIVVQNNFRIAGGSTTILGAGPVTATSGIGITVGAADAPTIINVSGPVTGVTAGIDVGGTLAGASTTTGNINITAANVTASAGYGIGTRTVNGATSVTDTGSVTASGNGIWTVTSGTGATTINANNVTAGGVGIYTGNTTGNVNITAGNVMGTLAGIDAGGPVLGGSTTTGNINISATSVTSAGYGIGTRTINGNTTITNVGTVTAGAQGIWAITSGTGVTNIHNNGNVGGITGFAGATGFGILAGTGTGDINIGTMGTNGVITAGRGIDAATTGAGNINVTTDRNVTGSFDWGIALRSVSGNITSNINGGTVYGNIIGVQAASAAGTVAVNVAAPATVVGLGTFLTAGVVASSTAGTTAITNAGTITTHRAGPTTFDVGAANDSGGYAVWTPVGGAATITNTGRIIGSAYMQAPTTFNNNAGGVWTPGTAAGLANTLGGTINNNAGGLINIRTGDTVMFGSTLNNNAGGVIDMQYGGTGATGAQDTLTVMNFSPRTGSTLRVNVEAGAANGAGDSGGQGRGDTVIVTGAATPTPGTLVDIRHIGAAPTTLTGSIAIVNTAAGDVLAPAPGAQLAASANYVFGAQDLPQFGQKYKYTLVDDALGGVFLVWQPNITAETMGAYGGGRLGSPAAGRVASAGFAGAGGFGGGASSGGAGRVGDAAAGSAMDTGSSAPAPQASDGSKGPIKPRPAATFNNCGTAQNWTVWTQADATKTSSNGGSTGTNAGGTLGIEYDFSSAMGARCGRYGLGAFGSFNTSDSRYPTGAAQSDTKTLGAFIRGTTEYGLYGALIGTLGRSDNDMVNNIFGSTAKQKADNQALVGMVGYVYRLAPKTWLDNRFTAGIAQSNGGAFTDSVGIQVSGSTNKITSLSYTLGLHHGFTDTTTGFIRGGVRWTEVQQSMTAFGIKVSGKGATTFGSAEAGFTSAITPTITLQASGLAEFSKDSRTYGGSARLSIKF